MANHHVYLGLGGNVKNPLFRIQQALVLLYHKKSLVTDLKISHYYQTFPVDVISSHLFVNAVCSFRTPLELLEVYKMTHAIEILLGKTVKSKNEDRPIDIDLLFYDHQVGHFGELEVPHPRWKERLFVLIPLLDLTEEIQLSGEKGIERYSLPTLIQPLIPHQAVSLLEKNPYFQ